MALPCSDRITVDLTPGKCLPVCHASQFDEGRIIRVDFVNDGLPYEIQQNDSFELNVRKPDNTVVTRTIVRGDPSIQTTYCYISTTQQMVAVAGDNICEIKISDGDNNTIGTGNFIMRVEKSPLDGGVTSASAIHDLETQIENILSSESLGDLGDVDLHSYVFGRSVLMYDGTSEKWVDSNVEINELDGVTIDNPTTGQVLTYREVAPGVGGWRNASPGSLSVDHLSDIGDVDITGATPYNNGILVYNTSTGKWEDCQLILSTIADTDFSNLNPGQVLTYYEQNVGGAVISGWRNESIVTYMYSLQDVNIDVSTFADGDILVYHSDDDDWENEPFELNSLRDVYASSPATGKTLRYNTLTSSWNADYIKSTDINYVELTGTLTSGSTSITLTDTGDLCPEPSLANLDFYTSIYGVNLISVTVTDAVDPNHSTITLTFEAQSTDMGVKVRIS